MDAAGVRRPPVRRPWQTARVTELLDIQTGTADPLVLARAQVLEGGVGLSQQQALELLRLPDARLPELLQLAHDVRERHCGPEVEVEGIVSLKTGGCPEDCAYCPQSSHHETDVGAEKMLDVAHVIESARRAKELGSTRFCMGAAWRSPKNRDIPKVAAMMGMMGRKLWVKAGAGGLARYERDHYFRVTEDVSNVPGNPWIICTLWLAEWHIAKAKTLSELTPALDILEWVRKHTLESGVLAEQIHPYSGDPISVSPLTWSHATVVMTVREYLAKLDELCESESKNALLSGNMDLYEMTD